MILVLWDIDRTLVYTGDTDRRVYRELFEEEVGRPAAALPERGTGVTMPLAVRELLRVNDVPPGDEEALAERIVSRMPDRLNEHRDDLLRSGQELPGARETLRAVHADPDLVPTVVTGNLQGSAEVKLAAFGLDQFLDLSIGGYASDNAERAELVSVAQRRAGAKHGRPFGEGTTVIIGDSLEDIRTGRRGGSKVISVASGTTPAAQLAEAGADAVVSDLTDTKQILGLLKQLASS
ncbi:HAD family hydrolase [Streptomyces sp. NPDC090306]|uniref:HAD family hydrolase n=1 Tax=Streptomyces sp. NPDC090306 TaxID=3365961 RepID=UPI0037FE2639